MTTTAPPEPVPTIPYFSAQPHTCPLCRKRHVWRKMIYGHPVCKKCFYGFANQRQVAYLIDALIVVLPNFFIAGALIRLVASSGLHGIALQVAASLIGLPLMLLFILKDGFSGQSPGKRIMGVQVLDEANGRPIGFAQSLKRNSVLLLGQVPIVGGVVALVVVIVIAMQVAGGYRFGDRFAKTKVIWKKYAALPVFGGDALACEGCGYDLQGNLSGICPECGTKVSERNAALLAGTAG